MKVIKYLALVAFVALVGATMTSCGGYSNGKAKDMIVKYNDGKLENDDYAKMIDWYIDFNDNYNDDWEDVIKDNQEYQEYKFAKTEMEVDYAKDYTFMGEVEGILYEAAGQDKMGEENKKKFEEYNKKLSDRKKALRDKEPSKK